MWGMMPSPKAEVSCQIEEGAGKMNSGTWSSRTAASHNTISPPITPIDISRP
jgi:hypothetical protein